MNWFASGRSKEALTCFDRAEELIRCLEHIVQLESLVAVAWCELGVGYRSLGRTKEALKCYDIAITINPTDPLPWNKKGWALHLENRHEEAVACFDRSLALDIRQSETWLNKGLSLMGSGRPDAALASFDRALELAPNDVEIRRSRVRALAKLGRIGDVNVEFNQIAELSSPVMKRLRESKRLSLPVIHAWASIVLRELPLSEEEVKELDLRTEAACERYGWPELGEYYTAEGEHEMVRNIAYLMLRRELSFRAAAFEYLSSMEKGCRKVAVDAELDSTEANLISAINDSVGMAK